MISTNKPAFRCSDETFNEIWRVCERSVWQHPGQDPVTAHADSMDDHTFYWFLSIYEHYLYTGNERCVRKAYPRMRKFINYCLSHTDSNGMIQIKSDDQAFVDWLPENRDRKGLRSFEQILYCKSLEDMAQCAHLLGRKADEERFFAHFTRLRKQILPFFWNEKRQALVHRVVDGRRSRLITRHSNVFAFSSITLPKLRSRRWHRLLSTILPSSLSHRLLCSSMSWLPFARWVTCRRYLSESGSNGIVVSSRPNCHRQRLRSMRNCVMPGVFVSSIFLAGISWVSSL